jgi:Fe-S-cluster containining protein
VKLPVIVQEYRRDMHAVQAAVAKSHRQCGTEKACKRGCSWCCTHAIPFVPMSDGAALAEIVRARPELADVPEKLLAQARQAAELRKTKPDILWPLGTFPCVFLGSEGECRIYYDRPFECSAAYSVDAAACEREAKTGQPGGIEMTRPWEAVKDDNNFVFVLFRNLPGPVRERMLARAESIATGENAPLFVAVTQFLYPEEMDRLTRDLTQELVAKGAL